MVTHYFIGYFILSAMWPFSCPAFLIFSFLPCCPLLPTIKQVCIQYSMPFYGYLTSGNLAKCQSLSFVMDKIKITNTD
jgi:hypothetical protein